MNILFISDHGGELGGGEKSMLELVKSLLQKKYRVFSILPGKGVFYDELVSAGVNVKVRSMPIIYRSYNPFKFIYWMIRLICFGFFTAGWVKKNKIQIIHANKTTSVFHGAALSFFAMKPIVWHVRNYNSRFGITGAIVYKMVDSVICISNEVAKPFYRFFKQNPEKINVVYNGVSVKPFYKVSYKSDKLTGLMDIKNSGFIVGMIGRITAYKRMETFLEAFRIISKTKHNIYGVIIGDCVTSNPKQLKMDMEYKEWLYSLHKRWHLENRVKFLGYRTDSSDLMKDLDVLVITSISEPFGRVIIEAMSEGIPVIGTQSGGIPEIIVDGKTGILFKPDDCQKLADSIILLCQEPMLRRRISESAWRRTRDMFSVHNHVENVDKIYRKILNLN